MTFILTAVQTYFHAIDSLLLSDNIRSYQIEKENNSSDGKENIQLLESYNAVLEW